MRTLAESRKEIEAALEYSDNAHSYEDIVRDVEDGKLQFWPGPNSVVITEIISYPRYKALNFFLAGGKMEELEVMYPMIEAWSRRQGCDRAFLTGRRGWERTKWLLEQNWKPTLVVMEKKYNG